MVLAMIQFLTTPIFYLTPYILLWSILNGFIVVGLLKLLKVQASRTTQIATGMTTAIASVLWNWNIEFNRSTIYLNVDHPYLRISWADFFNGVCVFALTSLVLGALVDQAAPARVVTRIAGIAALLTIITDTFFF
jgi:hypothetical protein